MSLSHSTLSLISFSTSHPLPESDPALRRSQTVASVLSPDGRRFGWLEDAGFHSPPDKQEQCHRADCFLLLWSEKIPDKMKLQKTHTATMFTSLPGMTITFFTFFPLSNVVALQPPPSADQSSKTNPSRCYVLWISQQA